MRQERKPDNIGPKQAPSRGEQLPGSRLEPRRALGDAHRRVQLLKMDEAKLLRGIRAEGERTRSEWHNEQEGGGVVTPRELEPCKRDRRASDRPAKREDECSSTRAGGPSLGTDRNHQPTETMGDEGGADDGERRGEHREHKNRRRGGEGQPADPARQAVRLVGLEGCSGKERAGDLGDDQPKRGCDEETEDDARVVNGERRRLGAVAGRECVRLGSEEEYDEAPPRHNPTLVRRAESQDYRHRKNRRGRDDAHRQADALRRGRTEAAPQCRQLEPEVRHATITRSIPFRPRLRQPRAGA